MMSRNTDTIKVLTTQREWSTQEWSIHRRAYDVQRFEWRAVCNQLQARKNKMLIFVESG